jgi:hypothetical protein
MPFQSHSLDILIAPALERRQARRHCRAERVECVVSDGTYRRCTTPKVQRCGHSVAQAHALGGEALFAPPCQFVANLAMRHGSIDLDLPQQALASKTACD